MSLPSLWQCQNLVASATVPLKISSVVRPLHVIVPTVVPEIVGTSSGSAKELIIFGQVGRLSGDGRI